MIELTKLNGKPVTLNADMIVSVEETPDTVVTLNTGAKLIIRESREEVKKLVILYKREIFQGIFDNKE